MFREHNQNDTKTTEMMRKLLLDQTVCVKPPLNAPERNSTHEDRRRTRSIAKPGKPRTLHGIPRAICKKGKTEKMSARSDVFDVYRLFRIWMPKGCLQGCFQKGEIVRGVRAGCGSPLDDRRQSSRSWDVLDVFRIIDFYWITRL